MTVVNPKSISGINSITTGSGSDNLLTIHTSDASNTERLRIDSTGATKIVTGIVTTLTVTTGIVTTLTTNTLTANSTTKVGSGVTLSPDGDVFVTGITTFGGAVTGSGGFVGNVTGNVTGNQSGGSVSATSAAVADLTSGRVVLAGSSGELQDDSSLLFGSNQLTVHQAKLKGNQLLFEPSGTAYVDHYTTGQDIQFRTSVSSSLDTTGPTIKSTGNIAFASGKGIDFSATANAGSPSSATSELFDDYEEGTWTPGLSGSDGITGQTYTSRNGFYTKIGNRVYCDFSFVINAKGSYSGTYIQLVNLPFPINGSSYTRSICTPIYYRTLNQRWCFLGLQGHEGQSKCYVFGVEGPGSGADGASNRSYPDGCDVANSTEMTGSFSYLVA